MKKLLISLILGLAFTFAIPQIHATEIKGNFLDIVTKGPWVDVRGYGAVGDGTTDDIAAIRLAIAATPTDGILFFPPGKIFKITEGATITKGITVMGYGSTLYMNGSSARTVVIGAMSASADSYLLFYNGASRNIAAGIPSRSVAGIIENVYIYGLTFKNTESFGGTYRVRSQPIGLYGVWKGAIKDCRFINGASEQILSDAILEDFEISGNYFYNCVMDGIAPVVTKNCRFHDNTFVNVYQPFEMGAYKTKIYNNKLYTSSANIGNGIWVSNTSLDIDVDVEIENNTIDGYFSHHILVRDDGANVANFKRIIVRGNHIRGSVPSTGDHFIRDDATSGLHIISDNDFDDYLCTVNAGYLIDIDGADTTGKWFIENNRAIIRTAFTAEFLSYTAGKSLQAKNNHYVFDGGSFRLNAGLRLEKNVVTDTDGVLTSGTGEDILKTITIPANFLGLHDGIRIKGAGVKLNGGGNKTIKLYFGATGYTIHAAANNTNDWRMEAEIINYAAGTQRISWICWDGATVLQGYEAGVIDTTAPVVVKLTGECADAGDVITQYFWLIDKI